MTPEIKVGQRWQDADPRMHHRIVTILEVRPGSVKNILIEYAGRKTWASANRFNGKRGGYRLVVGDGV